MVGGREGIKEGMREERRETDRREGGTQGGREGGRKRGKAEGRGGKEGGKKGDRQEGGRDAGREGRRERKGEGGREGRKGGRQADRQAGRAGNTPECVSQPVVIAGILNEPFTHNRPTMIVKCTSDELSNLNAGYKIYSTAVFPLSGFRGKQGKGAKTACRPTSGSWTSRLRPTKVSPSRGSASAKSINRERRTPYQYDVIRKRNYGNGSQGRRRRAK